MTKNNRFCIGAELSPGPRLIARIHFYVLSLFRIQQSTSFTASISYLSLPSRSFPLCLIVSVYLSLLLFAFSLSFCFSPSLRMPISVSLLRFHQRITSSSFEFPLVVSLPSSFSPTFTLGLLFFIYISFSILADFI